MVKIITPTLYSATQISLKRVIRYRWRHGQTDRNCWLWHCDRFKHMLMRSNCESAAFYRCGRLEWKKTNKKLKTLTSVQQRLNVRQYMLNCTYLLTYLLTHSCQQILVSSYFVVTYKMCTYGTVCEAKGLWVFSEQRSWWKSIRSPSLETPETCTGRKTSAFSTSSWLYISNCTT